MSSMAIHISEAEAARNFTSLLAKVRAGEEVIIEAESLPVAILQRPRDEQPPKLLSESIALATQHATALGFEPVMDEDFARDMEEIIRLRYERPRRPRAAWD